ncbi:MAG: hypothetical protein WC046_05455 [Candidatus Bathyarchaeia archaeon]
MTKLSHVTKNRVDFRVLDDYPEYELFEWYFNRVYNKNKLIAFLYKISGGRVIPKNRLFVAFGSAGGALLLYTLLLIATWPLAPRFWWFWAVLSGIGAALLIVALYVWSLQKHSIKEI